MPVSNTSTDPDFNDALTAADNLRGSDDPNQQEWRDTMEVTETVDSVGITQGVDAELKEQERQVQEDTLEVLEAMRTLDAGGTVKWRISRIGTGDPTLDGFLDTWPTKLVTLERIRDEMGGGTFYLKGFRNGKYWVHKTVEIAGTPKLYVRKAIGGPGLSTSNPNPNGGQFDLAQFLAQQEARDTQRRREEEERRQREEERDEKRRQDRLAMLAALAPAIATAFSGLFNRQDNTAALITALKPPPPTDPIVLMAQLKALMGNNDQAGVAKILPMLIDMAGRSNSGGDTGWLDVVKELAKSAGPTIGGMIEMSVQQAKANAAAAAPGSSPEFPPMSVAVQTQPPPSTSNLAPSLIVLPESRPRRHDRGASVSAPSTAGFPPPGSIPNSNGAAATASGPSNGTIPAGADMNYMALLPHLAWLKDQLARMGKAAVAQRDPELYAQLFVEELPDALDVNVVGQLLSAQDWYAKLVQVEPRLNREDLLPWFTAVRDGILRALQADPVPGASEPDADQAPRVAGPTRASPPNRPTVTQGVVRPTKPPSLTGED